MLDISRLECKKTYSIYDHTSSQHEYRDLHRKLEFIGYPGFNANDLNVVKGLPRWAGNRKQQISAKKILAFIFNFKHGPVSV